MASCCSPEVQVQSLGPLDAWRVAEFYDAPGKESRMHIKRAVAMWRYINAMRRSPFSCYRVKIPRYDDTACGESYYAEPEQTVGILVVGTAVHPEESPFFSNPGTLLPTPRLRSSTELTSYSGRLSRQLQGICTDGVDRGGTQLPSERTAAVAIVGNKVTALTVPKMTQNTVR